MFWPLKLKHKIKGILKSQKKFAIEGKIVYEIQSKKFFIISNIFGIFGDSEERMTILERLSTSDRVADVIRNKIISGEFPCGMSLNEKEICSSLGISRTPLRQALFELQGEGLIDIIHFRGARVFVLSPEEIEELGRFRCLLEVEALGEGLKLNRVLILDQLKKIVSQMQEAVEQKKGRSFSSLDTKFHSLIIESCENRFLINAYKVVSLRLAVLRNIVRQKGDEIIRVSLEEHSKIFSLVNEGNDVQAVQTLADHIDSGTELYVQKILEIKT